MFYFECILFIDLVSGGECKSCVVVGNNLNLFNIFGEVVCVNFGRSVFFGVYVSVVFVIIVIVFIFNIFEFIILCGVVFESVLVVDILGEDFVVFGKSSNVYVIVSNLNNIGDIGV